MPEHQPTFKLTAREVHILIQALLLAEEAGIEARTVELRQLRDKLQGGGNR